MRGIGADAAYKAPLYQFFLAAVFAISGFNFFLFFPLQAVLGGIVSGLVALIALETFRKWTVAAFAGMAAAGHPVLVNSASQPYNENFFFALLFGSIWAFVRWLSDPRLRWAVLCGALGGLAILSRETAAPLLAVMATYGLFVHPRGYRQALAAACIIAAVAGLSVVPWLVRNYQQVGIVSVSSGSDHVLGIGNNGCLAGEPTFGWYWADGPCPLTDVERVRLVSQLPPDQRSAAFTGRIDGALGLKFITEHPIAYVKLSLKRAWTLFLPFHPKSPIGRAQRAALSLYWAMVIPAGLVGAVLALRRPRPAVLGALRVAHCSHHSSLDPRLLLSRHAVPGGGGPPARVFAGSGTFASPRGMSAIPASRMIRSDPIESSIGGGCPCLTRI